MTQLFVFDLDRTLTTTNVSAAFGRYLYQHKLLGRAKTLTYAALYMAHHAGLLSLQRLYDLTRLPEALVRQAAHFVAEGFEQLMRPSVCAALRKAQENGATTWILSSSPDYLVGPIAEKLQVNGFRALVDGPAKVAALRGLQTGFQETIAYSDSIRDLPLLEEVGTAITVCPDKRLRQVAWERGWKIIDE